MPGFSPTAVSSHELLGLLGGGGAVDNWATEERLPAHYSIKWIVCGENAGADYPNL